jgi:hypothetical protein
MRPLNLSSAASKKTGGFFHSLTACEKFIQTTTNFSNSIISAIQNHNQNSHQNKKFRREMAGKAGTIGVIFLL